MSYLRPQQMSMTADHCEHIKDSWKSSSHINLFSNPCN